MISQDQTWLGPVARSSGRGAPRGQGRQRPLLALLAPGRQVRGVEPLAPQQGADRPGRGAAIGLAQDPRLVLGRIPAPGRLRRHLRVGHRRRGHRTLGRRALAPPSFGIAAPPFVALTLSFFVAILPASSSPSPTVIPPGRSVSPIIGTEGGR